MGRSALVTGATGFVGRHLAAHLVSTGWSVRALVRPTSDVRYLREIGVELVVGDLTSGASVAAAATGVDTLFHLAAVTAARTEAEYRAANETGTANVVDAVLAGEPGVRRLVYLSSYAAGGPAIGGRPRSCNEPPGPLTAYGRTKLAGEREVERVSAAGGEVLIVRAPAVYGEGDRALLAYFRLVRARLAPVPGGAERILHLIYAGDLALALGNAADYPTGTYAVADPRVHRWNEVIDAIARVLERRPVRIPLPTPLVRFAAAATEGAGRLAGRAVPFNREKAEEMLAPAWVCDLSGSEGLLPAERVTPLDRGLEQTVRWYIRQGWL